VAAKNDCNDVNANKFNALMLALISLQPFLAATFDFPLFSPRLLKAAHFFTAWLFLSRFHFFFAVYCQPMGYFEV